MIRSSVGRKRPAFLFAGFRVRCHYSGLSARVAELVYAYVSEAYPARVGSSSLPAPTRLAMLARDKQPAAMLSR